MFEFFILSFLSINPVISDLTNFSFFYHFFFYLGFFQEQFRFTGKQGKGEDIYLAPLYHLHPLQRHLDISWEITAESSPLHIASSQTRIGNL